MGEKQEKKERRFLVSQVVILHKEKQIFTLNRRKTFYLHSSCPEILFDKYRSIHGVALRKSLHFGTDLGGLQK